MDSRSYKVSRVALVTLQIILILYIMVTSIYSLLVAIDSGTLGQSIMPCSGNIIVSVMLLIYALYGYLHRDTSLRMACVAFLMTSSVYFSRLLALTSKDSGESVVICALTAASVLLMFIFCFTYKHRKVIAMISGGAATLINLVVGLFIAFSSSGTDAIKEQPFSMALLSGSITVCLITRYHWRENEKRRAAEQDEEI